MNWNFNKSGSSTSESTDSIDTTSNYTWDNTDWYNWTLHDSEENTIEEWMEVSTSTMTMSISNESERTEIEAYDFEWDGAEKSIEETIDEEISDVELVQWLVQLATSATKYELVWFQEYAEVPNNAVKLDALKTLAKMKWHFEKRAKKKQQKTGIKYILIR